MQDPEQGLYLNLEERQLGEEGSFSGYLAVFNEPDRFGEIFKPGAFEASIEDRGPTRPLFWVHNPSDTIGSLTLREDSTGLRVEGQIALTEGDPLTQRAYNLLKMGAVRGLSQGFNSERETVDEDGRRVVTRADVLEGSLVPIPRQDLAQVAQVRKQVPGLEAAVRKVLVEESLIEPETREARTDDPEEHDEGEDRDAREGLVGVVEQTLKRARLV